MDMLVLQNTAKQFLPLVILAFALAGFLGAGYFGMAFDAGGEMSVCPLMGESTFCRMNPLEHISVWQRMFAAVPQKDMLALLLFVLFSISTILAVRRFFHRHVAVSAFGGVALRRVSVSPIGRVLQEMFSQGILNPKIF